MFFSGMPSEAAGPVADTETPTLMSANAAGAKDSAAAAATAARMAFLDMAFFPGGLQTWKGREFSTPALSLPDRGLTSGAIQTDVFSQAA